MDEMEALRELILAKFEAQDQRWTSVVQRFDGQDRTLARIEQQTTLTNGRVNALEKLVAGIVEQITGLMYRLTGHDRELRELKHATKPTATSPTEPAGENRRITQRDVFIVLGTIGTAWAVMQAIGLLKAAAQ